MRALNRGRLMCQRTRGTVGSHQGCPLPSFHPSRGRRRWSCRHTHTLLNHLDHRRGVEGRIFRVGVVVVARYMHGRASKGLTGLDLGRWALIAKIRTGCNNIHRLRSADLHIERQDSSRQTLERTTTSTATSHSILLASLRA